MEKYIGYGYTNNKGIAKLEYDETGTQLTNTGVQGYGRGKIDLKAKMHKDSATQSDPFSVLDCIYYDKALGGTGNYNDSIWFKSSSTLTRQSDGSLLEVSSVYGSIGLGTTTSTENVYINDGLILEFDLIERNGDGSANVQWKRSSDNGYDSMPSRLGHHKHTIYKNKQLFTVDDEIMYNGWVNKNLGDYIRISVYSSKTNTSVKFANFKLYPI